MVISEKYKMLGGDHGTLFRHDMVVFCEGATSEMGLKWHDMSKLKEVMFTMKTLENDVLAITKKRANRTLAGCIINVTIVLAMYVTLSLYIPALAEKFNASITAVALLFSFASVSSLVLNLGLSAILDKAKIRVLVLIGDACFLLFLLCMIVGGSIALLYVGATLFGLSTGLIGYSTAQPLISWWHAKNTGKKISFLAIGWGLFAVVLSTVASFLLSRIGFESTIAVQLVVFGVLLLISSLFLISEKPSAYGLMPYQYEAAESESADSSAIRGVPFKKCITTFAFWGIFFCILMMNAVSSGFVNNAAMYLQSCGLDPVKAGVYYSAYNLVLIAWTFGYGVLCDKIGTEKASVIYLVIAIVAYILSALGIVGGTAQALLAVAFFGTVSASVGMIGAVSYGKIFGTRAIGTLICFSMVASSVGAFITPLVTMSYSSTGNFRLFLVIAATVLSVALILFALSTSKKSVEKASSLFE